MNKRKKSITKFIKEFILCIITGTCVVLAIGFFALVGKNLNKLKNYDNTSYEVASDSKLGDMAGGYFTILKEWKEDGITFRIVYAKDTKVKYFVVVKGVNRPNIDFTPLYNSDGTVQIYNGE